MPLIAMWLISGMVSEQQPLSRKHCFFQGCSLGAKIRIQSSGSIGLTLDPAVSSTKSL